MLEKFFVKAPAKINLGLNVLPKRADGFHGIESIFSTINLFDELEISLDFDSQIKNQCVVSCDKIDLPENNTITLAYNSLKKILNNDLPFVNVVIKKNIPSGGGLGGGSSDAASFLLLMNKICNFCLSEQQFYKIASEVGSDVFFFLNCGIHNSDAAIVTGRGEKCVPISKRKDLHYLLVFPGIHSSTKEAYALVDEFYESGNKLKYPSLDLLESIYQSSPKNWTFVNTFTKVISKKYFKIEQAIFELEKNGALYTDMSGSGSTVFGVFNSSDELKTAFDAMACSWTVCSCFN